ncbi:MAG: alkyl hydroperoxide reductase/Thiol specific antioxidant/Mal allergen [Chloroflexi bacterium]|nr:alkyl hydroperoxide reductase/Thiol specific antioxidant/Mal allergen [Chloroflexota bacterium]
MMLMPRLLPFLMLLLFVLAALNGCRPSGPHRTPAPALTLQQFSGEQISLADLRGRTVLVNFWASWCVPCREEMPVFEDVWRAQREAGFTVLGVAIEDDELSLTSFLRAFDISYPAGLDRGSIIARAYGVIGLPTTVLVSPDGSILRRWAGPVERESLLRALDEARTV